MHLFDNLKYQMGEGLPCIKGLMLLSKNNRIEHKAFNEWIVKAFVSSVNQSNSKQNTISVS